MAKRPPGIFISYRRSDAAGHAGRVFDNLCQHLGRERVFMDVDTIGAGDDFVDRLEEAVESCEVFLPVIGPSWSSVKDDAGRRRLDDPEDFVRREVATALDRGIRIIPVLVGGAAMPSEKELPAELSALSRRNAIRVSDTSWDYDTSQLREAIAGAPAARVSRRVLLASALVATVAVVATLWSLTGLENGSPPDLEGGSAPANEQRLVVLPFENLGDPDDEYFAAGMTEELRSRLASVPDLVTVSGQSATRFTSGDHSTGEIARELNVKYIITGSVRWAKSEDGGSRIRFNPGLVDAQSDVQLWSEVIETTIEDVFATQSSIASRVVRELGITLFEDSAPAAFTATATSDLNAYQHYLRGLFLSRPTDWGRSSLEEAIASFEAAVALDPGFTQAWAGLARTHAALHFLGFDSAADRCAAALEAVHRAELLDPRHRSTALASGYFHYWCENDYQKALAALEGAHFDLRNDAEVLSLLAHLQRRQGRWEESLRNRQLAFSLDPLNLSILRNVATTQTYLRRFEDAIATCDRLSALQADQQAAYAIKANNLWLSQGQDGLPDARTALEQAPGALLDWWHLLVYEGKSCEAAELVIESPKDWIRVGADAYPRSYLVARARELCGADDPGADYAAARSAIMEEMRKVGDRDYRLLSILARTMAHQGELTAALEAALASVEILPISRDSLWGSTLLLNLAEVHTLAGEEIEALEILDQLLAQPAWVSVAVLELDPKWNGLHDNPRYLELVARYGQQ